MIMVWGIGAVALLAALAIGGWWWLFRAPLPQRSGTLRVQGLRAPVEIVRDELGVPHIHAASFEDAVFGLGFVHWQDRPWQLELHRRIGAGRLSEVLGAEALAADRFLRRLGLRRAAVAEVAGFDADEKALLNAYVAGVNAAMAQGKTPLEFRLLGIKPAPWTPEDTVAWTKVMGLGLSLNWEQELFRYRLVQEVGPEVAARVDPFYPAGGAVIVEPGGPGASESAARAAAELQALYASARPYLGAAGGGASNSWVVSGSRTSSGKPMFANDPHLVVNIPAIWYEAHLICPETEVTGATVPGIPGVMIGHNRHVAWGQTVSCADMADLYIEKWDPERQACEFQGEWEPVQKVDEVIRVKGQPDVVETVYITRHGPIMAGGPVGEGAPLALRWVALEPTHTMRAVREWNTAPDAAAFRAALRHYESISMNVSFADDQGNIGYVMTGKLPIRAKGSGLLPAPGWTGEYEWTGYVSFEELPQLFNPPQGYIITANNKVADAAYPYHISWDFMPPWRADRAEELLAHNDRVTLADLQAMQTDVLCRPGLEFARHCRNLRPADPREQQALQALLAWDGRLTVESVGGAVYQVMLHVATRRTYLPLLGPELLDEWLGKGNILAPTASEYIGRSTVALLQELARRDPGFFALAAHRAQVAAAGAAHEEASATAGATAAPAGAAAAGATAAAAGAAAAGATTAAASDADHATAAGYSDPWDALLAASLTDAVAYLRQTLGDDPAAWQWGKLHRLRVSHPMAAVKPLHLLFPGIDVPIGGDTSTLQQTAMPGHEPYAARSFVPSYRFVADLADLSGALAALPGGQAGHPRSRNYLDGFALWYRGEYHTMLFGREAVARAAVATLRLEP
jgi:penicillin amidase